ncbi:hypothetical protein JCM19232_2722 [Vibrio ishigakensis]|uniref:GGDEF domain-containing protein n=1 Tax=Vibrio ishigakensis TaxID=1481914 RepID=A0A0B8PT19_9VIBR|nr:hypothetical protein JCM19232_2722 [Vibrio ishigakensis]
MKKVAVEAMKFGVHDYITKDDFTSDTIYKVINQAIKQRQDADKQQQLQRDIEQASLRDPITGLGNQYLFNNDFDLAVNKYRANGRAFSVITIRLTNSEQLLQEHGDKVYETGLKIFANRLRLIATPIITTVSTTATSTEYYPTSTKTIRR